jgi:uncharacterized protein (TIGR03437 family)
MRVLAVLAFLCSGILPGYLKSQDVLDNSANATFKGNYFLRHVLLSVNPDSGAITRARSILGTAAFDGNGAYTLAGTTMDSQSGISQPFNFTGTYRVAPGGLMQMQNPLQPQDIVDGGIGAGAFVGSSTESNYLDMVVAIPAGTATVANSALNGSYRVGTLDFLNAESSFTRDAYFTLAAKGDGTAAPVSVIGSAVNLGNTNITQTVNGVTYTLSGTGSGTLTFPATGSADTQLISGTKTLYLSADGSFLLGGSSTGFDMVIGIRAPSGVSKSSLEGTYFAGGFDQDASTPATPLLDAYYGSVHDAGSGMNYWHQRLSVANSPTFDFTFASPVNFDAAGSATKAFVHYDLSADGKAFLEVGRAAQYVFALGLRSDVTGGAGVFLNPLGIVNAANFAPITNSLAPNEIISLFGTGLANVVMPAPSLPLQTSLGGVQVTINGRPAPLFFVSPGQINALVPSGTVEKYAKIQVNNGGNSNVVTVYANNTAPGAFTLTSSGVGAVAALHTDFSLVNSSSPAKPGDTILLFVAGLGPVTPAVPDGAAAPSSPPLSMVTDPNLQVFFGDLQGVISFAGLAPGFAGLYQINVAVPAATPAGDQLVSIDNGDAAHQQAVVTIAAAAGGKSAGIENVPESGFYRPPLSKRIAPKSHREDGSRW